MNVSAPGRRQVNSTVVVERNVPLAGVAGAVGDVELQVVALHGQQLGAGGGVVAGQVGYGHTQELPTRRRPTPSTSAGLRAGNNAAAGRIGSDRRPGATRPGRRRP